MEGGGKGGGGGGGRDVLTAGCRQASSIFTNQQLQNIDQAPNVMI